MLRCSGGAAGSGVKPLIGYPILRLITDHSSKAVPGAVWLQGAKVTEAVLNTIFSLAPAAASFIFTYAGADEDLNVHKALKTLPYGAAHDLLPSVSCAARKNYPGA